MACWKMDRSDFPIRTSMKRSGIFQPAMLYFISDFPFENPLSMAIYDGKNHYIPLGSQGSHDVWPRHGREDRSAHHSWGMWAILVRPGASFPRDPRVPQKWCLGHNHGSAWKWRIPTWPFKPGWTAMYPDVFWLCFTCWTCCRLWFYRFFKVQFPSQPNGMIEAPKTFMLSAPNHKKEVGEVSPWGKNHRLSTNTYYHPVLNHSNGNWTIYQWFS